MHPIVYPSAKSTSKPRRPIFFEGSEDVELKFLRAKEQNTIYIFKFTVEIDFDTAKLKFTC